ncbi:hypothetical protein HO133_009147 [Letharia lupina]|uniref:PLC-like phosphodiesterase n=1 Tax=Letharia lupina TaxID=560253 RepID=A0A8H6FFJ6_9LECA|nr:uncharacterized protein HO133_009147 [Letharia lupina]KAF6226281.1 hypothetical protein HO133_009147 [Letharia lupina]
MRYPLSPISFIFSLFPLSAYAQALCNGHAELCSRQYSNITQIGTHDSAFVGTMPTDNQEVNITAQLDAGIRFLQAQSHLDGSGSLNLCHTTCMEKDAGPLSDYLTDLKIWLDANPNEVVTLLLTNGDNVNISLFDTAFTISNLNKYTYTPPTSPLGLSAWPTLNELIGNNTRLIAFLDTGAAPSVHYILDEFTYFFETPFDVTDPKFAECTLDRPKGATADGRMYIVNHFLDLSIGSVDIPDDSADDTTNAATGVGSIGAQVGICEGLYGRAPVGVLVDNFDRGNVFAAQDALNGLGGPIKGGGGGGDDGGVGGVISKGINDLKDVF